MAKSNNHTLTVNKDVSQYLTFKNVCEGGVSVESTVGKLALMALMWLKIQKTREKSLDETFFSSTTSNSLVA